MHFGAHAVKNANAGVLNASFYQINIAFHINPKSLQDINRDGGFTEFLAMVMPSAAATSEAAVLMLKVLMLSMPVPQFSTRGPQTAGWTFTESISQMASQMPTISAGVAPLAGYGGQECTLLQIGLLVF